MRQTEPEFDVLSDAYAELLRDPIRDRFGRGKSDFFHSRKRDLICDYFRRRRIDSRRLTCLDLGCGKGELLTLLRTEFAEVSGCDPSPRMLEAGGMAAAGIPIRVQRENGKIPFEDAQFDFVSAVCVYHHVPPPLRDSLTAEVRRVLKPGGVFAVIEHNPWNPVTRLIVSRTPVDAGAILLQSSETRELLRRQNFAVDDSRYFLYFPESIYGQLKRLESALRWLPLGGQYVVFASRQR